MRTFHSTRLYLSTLRHLRLRQMAALARSRLKLRVQPPDLPKMPVGLIGQQRNANDFPNHDPWNTRAELIRGNFCFLSKEESIGNPPDWNVSSKPLLWQFNLHYFNYLHLLGYDAQVDLCRNWIEMNPPGSGVGWHPYPTSVRIVNWCKADLSDAEVQQSIYQQGAFLYRNLEWGVLGNHLLENARALVFAGYYFSGKGESDAWIERGLRIFRDQTSEQIMVDGGHFERSPMYHSLVLEGYLDLLILLPDNHRARAWLEEAALRMGDFMASMSDPEDKPVLLNDSSEGISLDCKKMTRYLQVCLPRAPILLDSFPNSGYYIHRSSELFLIIDGGETGPDHVLGHAHADIFSYILWIGGQEFVVDSGVFEYESGPMRQYSRSTLAHNTVSIDRRDQIECWGSFRVGRRYKPYEVSFERKTRSSEFSGFYSGYGKLIGDNIIHRRRLSVDESKKEIGIFDTITGRNTHRAESRIHFHPSVDIQEEEDRFLLVKSPVRCHLDVKGQSWRWEEGWYSPQFGKRIRNRVLVLGGSQDLPIHIKYQFRYES